MRDEKTETTANDTVSKSYEENISYVRNRFNVPINNDIVIRELVLKEGRKAFIVFIDGMVSTDMVDLAIIKTLLEIPYFSDDKIYSYETEIIDRFIAHSQAITTNSMDTIFEEVNFGGCAVFVDGFFQKVFHLMFVNGVREVSVNLKMNSLFMDRKRHLQKCLEIILLLSEK